MIELENLPGFVISAPNTGNFIDTIDKNGGLCYTVHIFKPMRESK